MSDFLPEGYKTQTDNVQYLDAPGKLVYQPHVYDLAFFLAERCGAKWIIDIGCGSGSKLKPIANRFSVIGIDCVAGLVLARQCLPQADLIEYDLENGLPPISENMLRHAVVICSDVVEHLQQPEKLLQALARMANTVPFILVSTPDRDRARGWLDNGPPANPAHVVEWAANEFVRLMRHCGFCDIQLYGHTINTNLHRAKTTLLAIAGTNAVCDIRNADFRVAAIIHTYNEADVLPEVVAHLVSQGIEVHIFDNWSTDGTWEIISELHQTGKVVNFERFPKVSSSDFQWHEQLKKTTEYAVTLDVQWVIHHDADEIRTSPWMNITLRHALAKVDQLGYNAIDFTVVDFRFLANCPDVEPPYQHTLTHFEFGRRPGHFCQIKGWKNSGKVHLASSGGHEAIFDNRRVFPLKFLLKHYPLRNRVQARNKVFCDRLPRFKVEKKLYGWHTQYDHLQSEMDINGWDAHALLPWHPIHFMNEFFVERISGLGLVDTESKIDAVLG